jgi:Caspase domain
MKSFFAPLKRVVIAAIAVAALCLPVGLAQAQTGPTPSAAVKVQAATEARYVHVLLVADTDELRRDADGNLRGIGQAVGKDVVALSKALEMVVADQPELTGRIKLTVLTGKDATPANIRAYYRDLSCGPNDNLFFYLSSHGGMRRGAGTAEGAHLLMVNSQLGPNGWLSRLEVRTLMERKRPRGLVLLTDVCSSYLGDEPPQQVMDRGVRRRAPGLAPNAQTVRNLLFRAPNRVNITAAQDGTAAEANHVGAAFGGARSAFTVALLHLLCDGSRTFATWEELFPALQEETYKASGRLHSPRHFGLMEQPRRPGPTPAPSAPETGPVGPRDTTGPNS